MTWTVVGVVTDELGACLNRSAWATPAAAITVEDPEIPVDREHDHRQIGRVLYLERHAGNVWAVAEVNSDPCVAVKVGEEIVKVETDLYFSASTQRRVNGDVLLRSVSITASPALVGQRGRPLRWFPGDLSARHGVGWQIDGRNLDGQVGRLVAGAAEARYRQGPLIIHDLTPGSVPPGAEPVGPVLHRSAETISVKPRLRQITVLACPYNEPTTVLHKGQVVEEIIDRSAFRDAGRHRRRIGVLRDHDETRLVGRVARVDPGNQAGLVCDLQIADTQLGAETVALAEADCLSSSIGFRPRSGGLKWERSDRYRLVAAELHHVALVPDPAYETAKVLAVRATPALH